jgi:YVTN family beta-propeller protein
MLSRMRRQALLRDRYLTALHNDPSAQPPAGLDPATANFTARLADDARRLDPTAPFIERLQRRLEAEARAAGAAERDWERPAIDLRRRTPSQPIDATDEEIDMSQTGQPPHAEPFPIQERRWLREAAKLAAAALAFGLVGALLALALRGDDQEPAIVPGAAPTAIPTTVTPTIGTPTSTPGATRTATEAAVAPTAAPSATATQVVSDPSAAGEVVATITVGGQPEIHAFAAGSLWVSNAADATVSRIDTSTNQVVATIPVGSVSDHPPMISAYADQIWVLNPQDQTLMRIDPTTNTIMTTLSIGTGALPVTDPQRLAVGDGAIWVSDTRNNQVLGIDPETQTVVAIVPDINLPHSIGVTADAVWVAGVGTKEIIRIDPATNQIVARISPDRIDLDAVYVFGDEIWASGPGHIVRIDPTSNQLETTIDLPAEAFFDYGGFIGVDDGTIWFAAWPATTLYRVDIASQTVTPLFQAPMIWVVYGDGSLWLSGLDPNEIVRINPAR